MRMGIRTFVVALASAVGTTAVLTVVTRPLAPRRLGAAPGMNVVERCAGFSLATAVIVTVVHTPLLMLTGWITRGRLGRVALAIGGAAAVFVVLMLVPMAETGSIWPVAWTIDGWIGRPAEFAADWLPLLAGGAAFAAAAWRRQR